MKTSIKHIIIFNILFFSILNTLEAKNIYLVFYATANGKSGHTGIAIDNYKVIAKDTFNEKNERITTYDTISDGTLTYYDLWPKKDHFNALNVDDDVPAKYFKLPAASWENRITVNSLITKGIPHEEFYPVDGLIKIPSTPKKDNDLKTTLDHVILKKKPFNVRTFNCSDFVKIAIEKHCNCTINAKESIVFKLSTTPNKLYQEVLKLKGITVIKDAGDKANGSFTMERLLKRNNANQ